METKIYLRDVGKIINQIKEVASEYYEKTGRPLGATGEIAEYEVVRLLNLEISEVRQPGYDAIRYKGQKKEKIQIRLHKILDRIGIKFINLELEHKQKIILLNGN